MKTNFLLKGLFLTLFLSTIISCEQEALTDLEQNETSTNTEENTIERAFPNHSTGEIVSAKWYGQEVVVEKIENQYILEGDILIIPDENNIEAKSAEAKSTGRLLGRWEDNIVYYTIDGSLPNISRVTNAIAHWEAKTPLNFTKRTVEYNYVHFVRGTGCSSYVGKIGGRQIITLGDNCSTGNVIHEIGHAIGLWHEHNRKDRNRYLTVNYENIEQGREFNFRTYSERGYDGTEYTSTLDYNSVMMYDSYAFSVNGRPTITNKNGSTFNSQRNGLSSADITGINIMYPSNLIERRWATKQAGFWNTQQWLSGDFNGDGKDDIAKAFSHDGFASVDVHLSSGSAFGIQRWATKQAYFYNTQQWLTGDFNGDGKDDVAKAFNHDGFASIDVHLSNGSSFTMQRWATKQAYFWDAQQWVVGDFNGDGKDDIAKAFNHAGFASVDVHLSSGSAFTMQRWATKQAAFWNDQKWVTGDFNGDNKDDIAKVFNHSGLSSIDVHVSSGTAFAMQRWATKQAAFWNNQKWMSGDFNGDGKDDFTNVFNTENSASFNLHLSSLNTFKIRRWETKQGTFTNNQQWLSGDFNGDGKDDLTKVFNDSNSASIDVHLTR